MQFFILHFSAAFYFFFALMIKVSPQQLFSDNVKLCISLRTTNQVLLSRREIHKAVVLNI